MKYYVYFDAYGHARKIVSQQELAAYYGNDPEAFLAAMCPHGHTSGHVGTMSFDTREQLEAYLAGLGDEVTGFYVGSADSRPYNF